MRGPRASVMALALFANLLAVSAFAQDKPAPAPSEKQQALPLRQDKPLVLAQESSSGSTGWKMFALTLVAGAGLYAWRRQQQAKAGARVPTPTTLQILRRTSVGVRSELLVVEVEGKRLLLGVTPGSIQTLSVLADESEEALSVPGEQESSRSTASDTDPVSVETAAALRELEPRSEALRVQESRVRDSRAEVEERDRPRSAPKPSSTGRIKKSEPKPEPVEGQARGLLDLRSLERRLGTSREEKP